MDVFSKLMSELFGFFGINLKFAFYADDDDKGGGSDDTPPDKDDKGDDDTKKDQKDQKDDNGSDDKPLTIADYKALVAAQKRKSKEQLDELNKTHQKRLEQLEAKLEKLMPKKEPDDDSGKKKKSAEFFELEGKYNATKQKLEELARQNKELEEKGRQFSFETIVKSALARQGCTKIEQAFRVIAPDMTLDESGKRVFATVETESGEVDLDADAYVRNHVSKKLLPEFFDGKAKAGSPASGGRTGDSDYDFTMEQVSNPAFYKENREAIDKAMAAGRIKGI